MDRSRPPPAGKFSAARSHVMNDKYMADFEKAWEEMHGMQLGAGRSSGSGAGGAGPGPGSGMGGRGAPSFAAQQRSAYAALEEPSSSYGQGYGYGAPAPAGRAAPPSPSRGSRLPPSRPASRASGLPAVSPPASRNPSSGSGLPSNTSPRGAVAASPPRRPTTSQAGAAAAAAGGTGRYPSRVALGWHSGPVDPAGVLCDLSDRPSTCSAADWARGEVVVGSTDHALYVLDAVRGLRKRTLYNKACGHTEWVTCVTYADGGRIVSGGMDSKLWVWPAGGTRGVSCEAHFGPISQVKHDPTSGLVASASYDKTLRLWQLGARAHEVGCLQGHEAPVLEMEVGADGRIVSGDRSGHILLWDMSGSSLSWRMKNVHAGHVTALAWFGGGAAGGGGGEGDVHAGCFVSGGQDGVVRVWDPRVKSNVAKVAAHVNAQGRGAVGDLVAGGAATGGMVVTAGADGTLRVLDPRSGFTQASAVQLTDFPYSMAVAGGVAVVGCGDGSIHFIDIQSGRTLYALGANRAAVRCMEATYDRLACSGDDGKAVLYTFA